VEVADDDYSTREARMLWSTELSGSGGERSSLASAMGHRTNAAAFGRLFLLSNYCVALNRSDD
jgi:hypothetical protein